MASSRSDEYILGSSSRSSASSSSSSSSSFATRGPPPVAQSNVIRNSTTISESGTIGTVTSSDEALDKGDGTEYQQIDSSHKIRRQHQDDHSDSSNAFKSKENNDYHSAAQSAQMNLKLNNKSYYKKAANAPQNVNSNNYRARHQVSRNTSSRSQDDTSRSLKNWLILILFMFGLIVCIASLLGLLLLPRFVNQRIGNKLVLKNGSMLLERWSKPNVPMFFKVWLFNVKNAPELVGKQGVKPEVEEIGPFVFNLKRQKDVISFAGDNLYYTERKVYKFNRELSCCAINTTVTIPNIPLVAVVDRALSYQLPLEGRCIPRLINRAIQSLREPMFVRKQVGEILFDGYDVELLKMVSRIGSLVGLPQQSQRFALLKGRNDTWRPDQDGVWAINTGERDRRLFGRVSSWNSYRRLPFWSASQCNVINGSDGTLFPPPIKQSEPLYIFNQELCRTVNLVFDRPSDVRSIQAYRFVLNPMNFAHTVSPPASGGSGLPMLPANLANLANLQTQSPQRTLLQVPKNQPLAVSTNNNAGANNAALALQAIRPSASEQQTWHMLPISSRVAPGPSGVSPNGVAGSLVGSRSEHQNQATSANVANLQTNEQEKLVLEAQRFASERHKQAETPKNPQQCFCDRKTTHLNGVNVCEFDGLIDLSKCSKQAQVIFGSMPHFFNSDPRLARQVNGMQPNASRHTTFLDIEPNTGLVLGGKRRVQLNLIVKRNNEIDGFENINDMLLPIVWFEESAQIPEEAARKFKSLYTDRIRLINLTLLSLFLASLVLLAIDLRLMTNTLYWRRFKIKTGCTVKSPQQQQHADGRFRHRTTHTKSAKLNTSCSESESSDLDR